MKRCSKCKSEKPVSEFSRDIRRKDGRRGDCLLCNREDCLRRRWNNVELSRERDRQRYAARKDDPEFKTSNSAKSSRFYYANKEAKLAYQLKYEQNRRDIDPAFRIEKSLRKRISGLLNKKGWKSERTLALLGCSIGRFMEYLKANFQPGMTFNNYGFRGWHIDHKRPCKSFDLSDPAQQKECFNWLNLQPLWATDNFKKGAKHA